MTTTFAFVTFAWVFFRSKDIGEALNYFERIYSSILLNPKQFLALPGGKMAFLYIIPLIVGDWWFRRNERKLFDNNFSFLFIRFIYLLLSLFIIQFWARNDESLSFIYFQF